MLSHSLYHRFCLCPPHLLPVRHLATTASRRSPGWGPAYENERMDRWMKKLMNRKSQKDLLHSKGVVVSQGAPNFLSRNKGDMRTISRRQKMLGFHFMEGITDVLANDDIGKVIKEQEVKITHVEVGQHYNYLNIFYTTTKTNKSAVAAKLKSIVGDLNRKMYEKNFMTLIPDIVFCYDQSKALIESVDEILKSKNSGIESSFKPQDFVPPTEVATGYHFMNPIAPRIRANKVALFVEEFRKSQEHVYDDKINYRTLKFVCPPDMRLDAVGLDYERIMNQVLAHMNRSRSDSRQNVHVADPLPPAVWIEDHRIPPDHEKMREEKPDTTIRLSTMRNFIIDHRRKRTKYFKEKQAAQNEIADSIAEDHLFVMEQLCSRNEGLENDEEDSLDEDAISAHSKESNALIADQQDSQQTG